MTDQVVDWGVCWQRRGRRQELMRFNWSVSCQLSLVPHLTLSDGASVLHLHEHLCVCVCVCEKERERTTGASDIYICVCVSVCVPVRDRRGVCLCVGCVIESKRYLGSPLGVVLISLVINRENTHQSKAH